MSKTNLALLQSQVAEEKIELTLLELCHACDVQYELVSVWVQEGLLDPLGQQPEDWRFDASALKRTRIAISLSRDLDINPAGVALALDLMDEIAELKAQIKRRSVY